MGGGASVRGGKKEGGWCGGAFHVSYAVRVPICQTKAETRGEEEETAEAAEARAISGGRAVSQLS